MNKKNSCLFVLLMLAVTLSAQHNKVVGGIAIGFGKLDWHGEDADQMLESFEDVMYDMGAPSDFEQKPRYNLAFGAFLDFPVNKNFSVQPELNYVMRGSKMDGSLRIEDYWDSYHIDATITYKTHYLELPVLLKLLMPFQTGHFYVCGGPSFNFLMQSKLAVKVEYEGDSDEVDDDLDDVFNGTDIGYKIGAGFELTSGLCLRLQYYSSFSSIMKEDIDIKNNALLGVIGFKYNAIH